MKTWAFQPFRRLRRIKSAENCIVAFYNIYQLETVCLRYFNVFGPRQDPASLQIAGGDSIHYCAAARKNSP
jgi:nucleoside-diphosphate-sugar epimerase